MENPERHFAARGEDGALIGFYYFELKRGVLEYGLGLRPDLTGRGLGQEFVRAGLEFGRARFAPRKIMLNVAAFNKRAIRVYERLGFCEVGRHIRGFKRWGEVEFVEMVVGCADLDDRRVPDQLDFHRDPHWNHDAEPASGGLHTPPQLTPVLPSRRDARSSHTFANAGGLKVASSEMAGGPSCGFIVRPCGAST